MNPEPAPSNGPEVSIIVPAYNAGEEIRKCLEALLNQQTERPYEIIVVDDGSTDNTPQIVKGFAEVRLLQQDNAGPAAARNRGIEAAEGRIILFTDDDCVPVPDWLEQMVAPLLTGDAAGAKGAYLTHQESLTARFVQVEYEEKYDRLKNFETIDFVDTYSAAFRRRALLECGGYDETFSTASAEDVELSFRMSRRDYRLVFTPRARVWHSHADSPLAYLSKKIKNGYWRTWAWRRNPGKIGGDTHTPITQRFQILLALLFPVSVLLAVWLPELWIAPPLIAVTFLISTVPLVMRCLSRDIALGCAAPFFIALRAGGLAAGVGVGLIAAIWKEWLGGAEKNKG